MWRRCRTLRGCETRILLRPSIDFMGMKKVFPVLLVFLCLGMVRGQEIDVTRLDKIGTVTSYVKMEKGITLSCSDNSQVQIIVLAPDLIRVRTSFAKPIPTKDHSWAIAKENWAPSAWTVNETA